MVTKRRDSSNPPKKQQPGSLETRRTVQFCQVHSLASFRGECVCCVSMSLLLSILLCADMFCCVSICVVGWFLLWVKRRPKFRWIFTVEAFVLVISISCFVFVVATLESYIAPAPHALMHSDVWLSVYRAFCFCGCGAASFLHLLSACFAQSGVARDILLVCFNHSGHRKIHQMWGCGSC